VALGPPLEAAAAGIGAPGSPRHFWATLIVLVVELCIYRRLGVGAGTHRPQERNKAGLQRFLVFGMMALGSFFQASCWRTWLVDGKHGGVPAGAARPCGAVVGVIRSAGRSCRRLAGPDPTI
jgi:hypothetical protein